MNKAKKESFFWTSYSDLMTSLFFVMLVLFVLVVALLHNQLVKIEKEKNATEEQFKKITEIEESTKKINPNYFEYDDNFKRHTLKNISISFNTGSSNFNDIPQSEREKLRNAGLAIKKFLKDARKNELTQNVQYLLIIEGQSSKDNFNTDIYRNNDVLSYQRALSLVRFWERQGIDFENDPSCEILVSGSGQRSKFRVEPDVRGNAKNQRFVIHIIPKPGVR